MTEYWDPICGRPPAEINEFIVYARESQDYVVAEWEAEGKPTRFNLDGEEVSTPPTYTPDDYVRDEEGTLDPDSGFFLCTTCYLKMGSPSRPWGWRATTENLSGVLLIMPPSSAVPQRLDQVTDDELERRRKPMEIDLGAAVRGFIAGRGWSPDGS